MILSVGPLDSHWSLVPHVEGLQVSLCLYLAWIRVGRRFQWRPMVTPAINQSTVYSLIEITFYMFYVGTFEIFASVQCHLLFDIYVLLPYHIICVMDMNEQHDLILLRWLLGYDDSFISDLVCTPVYNTVIFSFKTVCSLQVSEMFLWTILHSSLCNFHVQNCRKYYKLMSCKVKCVEKLTNFDRNKIRRCWSSCWIFCSTGQIALISYPYCCLCWITLCNDTLYVLIYQIVQAYFLYDQYVENM